MTITAIRSQEICLGVEPTLDMAPLIAVLGNVIGLLAFTQRSLRWQVVEM